MSNSLNMFSRLAREAGLDYVEMQNLTEFYDDNRYVLLLGNWPGQDGYVTASFIMILALESWLFKLKGVGFQHFPFNLTFTSVHSPL